MSAREDSTRPASAENDEERVALTPDEPDFEFEQEPEDTPVDAEELRAARLARVRVATAFLPALLGVALFAVPRSAGPGEVLALAGAALFFVTAAALVLGYRPHPSRRQVIAVAVAAVPAAVTSIAALTATNPTVSFLGLAGQHSGALLWIACWAVFSAAILTATRRTLLWTLRVLAGLGAMFTLTAALHAAGAFGERPVWGFASAPFENSNSLAAMLVLCLGCGAAWIAASRGAQRAAAWAATVVTAVGLLPTRSSGAWFALLAGLAFLGLLQVARRFERPALSAAIAWVAVVVLATGLLAAAAAGSLGEGPRRLTDTVGNMRGKIWRTSLAAIAEDPVTGRGPDQFTAWVTWTVDGPRVTTQGALDPHNALLSMAVATGIPGALLLLGVGGWLLFTLLGRVSDTGSPRTLTLGVTALVAWAAALGFSWIAPLPAVSASLLAGALIAACPSGPVVRWNPRIALAVTAATGALVAAAAIPAVIAETAWYTDLALGYPVAAKATRTYSRIPDPAYVIGGEQELIRRAVDEQDPAKASAYARQAQALSALAKRDRIWSVDLAFDAMTLSTARFGIPGSGAYDQALAAGRRADPATGLWSFAASRHALAAGDSRTAAAYAKQALTFSDLPDPVRASLQAEVDAAK
jgi:O-antigen ligase